MGTRTDAALALAALAAIVSLFVLVEAALAPAFAALGAVATVLFELLAARRRESIRRIWERPAVQVGSFAAAIGVAAVGARTAPSPVLSFCCGATVAYLIVLGLARTGAFQ